MREILKTWTQLSAPNQSDSNVNESGVLAELSLSTEVGTVKAGCPDKGKEGPLVHTFYYHDYFYCYYYYD